MARKDLHDDNRNLMLDLNYKRLQKRIFIISSDTLVE